MARKKKQPELPEMKGEGVEKRSVPAIEAAADTYVAIRDKRMDLTRQEVEAKQKLREAMQEHNLESYNYDDFQVFMKHGEDDVKVKRIDGGPESVEA